ncbi:uncharacterized protein LOC111320382 [Stylophora pistillata]|uniref:Ras guanine nucleotide exchange factor Y n=1 Tax=Stylophora pistillata TaxID=50429 RepID=A0A2B4STK1_STYPI|nr:uncharacterized protein LOC111320382 [Stylophora pistillata]PFX32666.1 Ras guanine nucleotide exchange factor Y [Stylophora pistillata]
MASDVEQSLCGTNNNIRSALRNGTASYAITEDKVLIESEFLELNSQLHYSKPVHILLTDEFVFVKEMRDRRESDTHVLQYESAKTVTKFLRSDVNMKVCQGSPFTFKAKWSKEASSWKRYELCGKEEVWPKWLRSFSVEEPQGYHVIPSSNICEMEGDSDSDDYSEEDDGEDIQMPGYALTLSVDRTISMWSMSMFNPSRVRRQATCQKHVCRFPKPVGVLEKIHVDDLSDSFTAESLYRSNSHPRLSLAKSFRCPSLPDVKDLKNVCVDSDLKNPAWRTRGQSSVACPSQVLNSSTLLQREGHNKYETLTTLQQKVENLRSHPTNLNFVRRSKYGDVPSWDTLTTPKHRRKHSLNVAMNSEANRIPMPSDSGTRTGCRSPTFGKQESIEEDILANNTHETKTPDASVSPKKTDSSRGVNQIERRSESLPSSKRTDLSHIPHPASERRRKVGVARQLDFKDDMAVDLIDGSQPPRKEKIRRFWTILSKKRPKLKAQLTGDDDSSKDFDSIKHDDENSSSITDCELAPNGIAGLARRGGLGSIFSTSPKDKGTGAISTNDEQRTVTSPAQSKKDPAMETTPIGKPSFSYSGSMKKKKLVKKILSPIFKATSQEEEISNQATSPTGEIPQSPDSVDSSSPDLSQRLVDIDASLFAREITLIDKELFVRIPWPELANCGWMTKDKYVTSPHVMAMVEFFNRIALLAASEVLSQETTPGRARAISKVIQIAEKCQLLGNFNSLKALLAGLQSTPVYRLKETWKEVPSKKKKKFRDLSILMGESENFRLYRAELSACLENGPCIPFLGNFLTEIAQTHTYLAYKGKNGVKGGKQSPLSARNCKLDRTDGAIINGETPKRNSITSLSVNNVNVSSDEQSSPRDKESVTVDSNDKRTAKVKRTPSRSKLWRFHNRQSINDSGVMLNRSRNNSAEVLDIPDGDTHKVMTSSTDSVINSTCSLNDSPRSARNGNARTSSKPSLLRRLSETSSNHNGVSFSKKPNRRLSETKSNESRRAFLKGLVRRTPSSQSVKEGRVSRGPSNEKLTVSLSTLSVAENSNSVKFKELAKSQSSPSVEEGGRLSPELSLSPLDRSPQIEVVSSSYSSVTNYSPPTSSHELQSGTEKQLWAYQIAAIQYDFVSRPFVGHFLLNASFNSEEDNYRLSLKRETPAKKTGS